MKHLILLTALTTNANAIDFNQLRTDLNNQIETCITGPYQFENVQYHKTRCGGQSPIRVYIDVSEVECLDSLNGQVLKNNRCLVDE